MKILRIIGAAFLVLLGAMVLVGWSVAGKTVGAIESGEAATNLTQKVLDDPDFADAAATRITERLVERTDGNLIGRIVAAFQPEIQQAIVHVLQSDQVNDAVTKSVSKVEQQLTEELTEPNRPSAPFTLSIDLSDRVNARIDQIPVIGTFIPEVTVPPIERELIDAKTFDSIRQVYGAIKFVASWGLLIGVVLIIGGFFVAPRSRWYWPQAILGTAILVLAVSIAVRRIIPAQIAGSVPGGESGGAGAFLKDFLNDNATGPMATRLLQMAFWAFVLAVLFAVIARLLPGWKDQFVPAKVVVTEPVVGFVAPVGVPDAVVTNAAPVATAPVEAEAAAETIVVASPASSPATAPDEETDVEPVVVDVAPAAEDAVPVAQEPAVVAEEPAPAAKAPARKPAAKAAPAKASPAKAAPTKAAPAKATAAKATPAKATPAAKPAAASDAPAPKPARSRKPTTPKE